LNWGPYDLQSYALPLSYTPYILFYEQVFFPITHEVFMTTAKDLQVTYKNSQVRGFKILYGSMV
jgi:hypothetical protein